MNPGGAPGLGGGGGGGGGGEYGGTAALVGDGTSAWSVGVVNCTAVTPVRPSYVFTAARKGAGLATSVVRLPRMRLPVVAPPLRMVKPTEVALPAAATLVSCTSHAWLTPKYTTIASRRLEYAVEALVMLEAAMPDSVHDAEFCQYVPGGTGGGGGGDRHSSVRLAPPASAAPAAAAGADAVPRCTAHSASSRSRRCTA